MRGLLALAHLASLREVATMESASKTWRPARNARKWWYFWTCPWRLKFYRLFLRAARPVVRAWNGNAEPSPDNGFPSISSKTRLKWS